MKNLSCVSVFLFLFSCVSVCLWAEPQVGQPAPDFTLTDIQGESISLSGLKGSYVVLEWVNYDCPFVKKHYESGNIPSLQQEVAGEGIKWFSICSSSEGKQGQFSKEEIEGKLKVYAAAPTAYLNDADGAVGKL